MDSAAQVTIYSAPWCAFCHAAKQFLDGKNVKYKDINVDEDHQAAMTLVQKTGQAGIPVLEIGNETIIGFDRPKIESALRANHLVD
jgi:glutaredoxin 3